MRGANARKARTLINLKDRHRLFWLLHTSGWLFYLAFVSIADWTMGSLTLGILAGNGAAVVSAFLVTLGIRHFYKQIKIRGHSIFSLSFRILFFSFAGTNAVIAISFLIERVLPGPPLHAAPFMIYLGLMMAWLAPFLSWSALYFGIKAWQEWRHQKEEAEKAEALAQTAQLQMLRYRMNPHFLFNTLNSIRALISEDKASAKSMVTELSEYLRYSLVSKNYETVPLKEEMESLRHYFNIQKTRYENKLDVSLTIAPGAEEYPVPSFLLHPLVENAVKYGMMTSPLPLKIRISAGVHLGTLRVDVVNSGSWVAPSNHGNGPAVGRGLDNVRRRLAEVYPGQHHFETFEKDGTVLVRLAIDSQTRR